MKPILFYIKNRHGFNGLLRVYEQLEKRGHTRVFLTTDDKSVEPYSQNFRNDLSPRFMQLEMAAQYQWAAIVSTHLPPNTVRLNGPLMIIPHDTGFGICSAYSEVLANNCILYFGHAPGEFEYLKKRLGDGYSDKRYVTTGCPSTDELARYVDLEAGDRRKLKRGLGLDPDLPVILVSSHWTPDSILRTWGHAVLAALEPFSARNSIVQIAHAGIWDFPAYDTYDPGKDVYKEAKIFNSKKLFDDLNTYCAGRKQFHFLPDVNTQKALAVADLLIGDYSSIIIEYCVLDRPIVFTSRPERFFAEINYHRYAAACGAAGSLEQLAAVVTEELDSPLQRSEARQALAGAFIWNLGSAAATVANEILKRI